MLRLTHQTPQPLMKGKKMINIQDIIPFMKKGWVAMDENGDWWWSKEEPKLNGWGFWDSCQNTKLNKAFDIAPADDWTQSLIKVGGNDERN